MTIKELIKESPVPTLDAELIIAFVLQKERTWLISHSDETISNSQLAEIEQLYTRRKEGEPLSYLTGKKEFYGREFYVNEDTLIPRPSTEGLIDTVLDAVESHEGSLLKVDASTMAVSHFFSDQPFNTIVDIGTGSGCIAITLALELPKMKVIGSDISPGALHVAKHTAEAYQLDIQWHEGDLLEPFQEYKEPFFVVSNPPYIPEEEELMKDVQDYEPHTALFSGHDGLDHIRKLIAQCKNNSMCTGIALECTEQQMSEIQKLLWS